MVKLVLNGCQLSTEDCNRVTSTVDLSSCSGGGGGGQETLTTLEIDSINMDF